MNREWRIENSEQALQYNLDAYYIMEDTYNGK